jgi:hypothetical protein
MFFSRLLRERFAGTPYAEHFLAGEAEHTDMTVRVVSRKEIS